MYNSLFLDFTLSHFIKIMEIDLALTNKCLDINTVQALTL